MTHDSPAEPDDHRQRPRTGVGWVLPYYDSLSAIVGITRAHDELLRHADIHPGHRVLDIGCGTGAMALRVKHTHPQATVVGLDPDQPSLDRARRKALAEGLDVQLDLGSAGSLPYADDSVDRIVSAFAIHHLADGERLRAYTEMLRVLSPTGSLHLMDFGRGDHLATDLRDAGVRRGRLTRGSVVVALPVTIVDAHP